MRTAMMAITTNNSIKVKPLRRGMAFLLAAGQNMFVSPSLLPARDSGNERSLHANSWSGL
jgi:hypothetical protein